jgi:hypothetical protein
VFATKSGSLARVMGQRFGSTASAKMPSAGWGLIRNVSAPMPTAVRREKIAVPPEPGVAPLPEVRDV